MSEFWLVFCYLGFVCTSPVDMWAAAAATAEGRKKKTNNNDGSERYMFECGGSSSRDVIWLVGWQWQLVGAAHPSHPREEHLSHDKYVNYWENVFATEAMAACFEGRLARAHIRAPPHPGKMAAKNRRWQRRRKIYIWNTVSRSDQAAAAHLIHMSVQQQQQQCSPEPSVVVCLPLTCLACLLASLGCEFTAGVWKPLIILKTHAQ